MPKNRLLPQRFIRIGWAILIPTAILGFLMWLDDFNGIPSFFCPNVKMNVNDPAYNFCHSETTVRILNNIALIGTLVGSLLITCSRTKIEDEMIGNIRLNALLTAFYVNFTGVIVASLVFYDIEFLNIMIYSLIGLPLLFLAIFQWMLWRLKKSTGNDE